MTLSTQWSGRSGGSSKVTPDDAMARTFTTFALLPRKMTSGKWVWLSKYYYMLDLSEIQAIGSEREFTDDIPHLTKIHTWSREEVAFETLRGNFINGCIAWHYYLKLLRIYLSGDQQ